MYPRLRSRFLRALIDSLQPGAEGALLAMVRSRLPSRLATVAKTAITTARDPSASVALDDAEALLMEIDSVFGEGSGRALEAAGRSLAARILSEGSVAASADLGAALRVLQSHLEQSFEDVRLYFDLDKTDHTCELTLGVAGRPRSTRILRHLVIGYLKAASTATGLSPGSYRIYSETSGDRATVMLRPEERISYTGVPPQRPPSASMRAPAATLRTTRTLAEVERILGASGASGSRSSGAWPTISDAPSDAEDRVSEERPVGGELSTDDDSISEEQDRPRPSRRGSA